MPNAKPLIGRYARILLDDWFRRAFAQESRLRLLQLFLQEVLPERQIGQIRLDNSEHVNPFPGKRDIRVDVECTDAIDGSRFVVEVQVAPQKYFRERALFNTSFAIQQQKQKGESDYDFPTVYFIGLMDFSSHGPGTRVDYRYSLREDTTGELMTRRVQFIFLELPNSMGRALTPAASILDNICFALHQMEHLTEQPAELKEEIFKLLFESAEIATFTPAEKTKYENDMTTERDRINQLAYAEEKGLEKGRAEGIAEGARKQAESTARSLLTLGVSHDIIIQATGLTLEEVEALQASD